MFSSHSVSFGGNATCNKCIIFVALEVTVFELEGQLCSVEKPAKSRVLLPSLAPTTIDSPPAFFLYHNNSWKYLQYKNKWSVFCMQVGSALGLP